MVLAFGLTRAVWSPCFSTVTQVDRGSHFCFEKFHSRLLSGWAALFKLDDMAHISAPGARLGEIVPSVGIQSGDTTPCRMTGVTLHGDVSPDRRHSARGGRFQLIVHHEED